MSWSGEREFSDIRLGRRSAGNAVYLKDFTLGPFFPVQSVFAICPLSHLKFNEPAVASEVRCDNSTVKQHCMGSVTLNCFTLNRKSWDNRGDQLEKEEVKYMDGDENLKYSSRQCEWGEAEKENSHSFPYFYCFSPFMSICVVFLNTLEKVQKKCSHSFIVLASAPTFTLLLTLHSFFPSPAAFPFCTEATIVVRFCFFLNLDRVCQQAACVSLCLSLCVHLCTYMDVCACGCAVCGIRDQIWQSISPWIAETEK